MLFTKLIQVGMVTRNISKVIECFTDVYNIGPWYVIKFSPENVDSMTLYGKKQAYSMDLAVCPIGDVRFEYIEPITSSIYSDFYKTYGENIVHHLKLGVDDLKKALDFLGSNNIEVIQSGEQIGGSGKNIYTYVDTKKQFGFITEIVHITRDFIKPDPDHWFPPDNNKFNPIFLRPSAVGIVVKNIEARIRDYQKLNIGPWEIYDFEEENNLRFKAKMAFCRLDNLLFKLIEPKSVSIFSEFLEKSGENIHHIKMEVQDYEKTLHYLQSRGVKTILSGFFADEVRFSFLDTSKDINFITEISNKSIEDDKDRRVMIHP